LYGENVEAVGFRAFHLADVCFVLLGKWFGGSELCLVGCGALMVDEVLRSPASVELFGCYGGGRAIVVVVLCCCWLGLGRCCGVCGAVLLLGELRLLRTCQGFGSRDPLGLSGDGALDRKV